MKLTIKRVHILNAIRFNNLVAGRWFERRNFDDPNDKVIKPNCTACLVGSTVKRAAKPKTKADYERLESLINNVTEYGKLTDFDMIGMHLDNEDYLSALSCKFEGTVREKANKKYSKSYAINNNHESYNVLLRKTKLNKRETNSLIQWVKDNIPTQFTMSDKDY